MAFYLSPSHSYTPGASNFFIGITDCLRCGMVLASVNSITSRTSLTGLPLSTGVLQLRVCLKVSVAAKAVHPRGLERRWFKTELWWQCLNFDEFSTRTCAENIPVA